MTRPAADEVTSTHPLIESHRVEGTRARTHEGSGLGLFISRRLMEAQHASIRLQSRPGGGSSFVLHFPAGRAA